MLSLTVAIVALAAHWFQVLATPAFFWAMGLSAVLAVLALLLFALGFHKVWYYGYRGGTDLVIAAIVSTLVLVPFAIAAYWTFTHPLLTDITTDLDDPPVFSEAARARTRDMNAIRAASDGWRAEQLLAYPAVSGRRYEVPIENVREAVERTFEARGWGILGPYIVGTGTEFNIEATVRSLVLALPSDVIVRLIEDSDGTFVDMRSTSRYGETDFGENADRITAFLKDLDVAVATQIPVVQRDQ